MADISQRSPGPATFLTAIARERSDIMVAAGVVAVVMMLIIPLPAVILDLFMAFNLVFSLVVILIVLYTHRALDFSVFPTILLVSTVFSLALNVSSTRLILSQGTAFDGRIVRAFATFVVGTNGQAGLVIGIIIFLIIIALQFIVITKGATRVAEVAARFTLDSLPGKQMAIEAEYNSGAISEEEATKRKNDLQKEVDFYGAMDGASKFVSGNVKVGFLITLINMLGGIIVGTTIHGESIGVAAATYTMLTIGDGLVSQFPALLISTATGLIVTRAISDGTFGSDVSEQFSRQSRVYWIAAVFLFLLGLLPGFPWYVLLPLSLLVGFTAYRLGRKEADAARITAQDEVPIEDPAEISPVVPMDPISLELGYGLIPLVDKEQGAELLDRITRIRRETALELGLVVPRIRIIDNMRLEPSEYCIKIKGTEVGKGTIRLGSYLAINPGGFSSDIPGDTTKDPAFGLDAKWITEDYREQAEREGFTVVDNPSVLATHLTEVIKNYASDLLGRQETSRILDALAPDYSAVVNEVKKDLPLGIVHKVFQRLLQEHISIRNIVAILEALSDYAPISKEATFLTEKVRKALARQISIQYADEEKTIHVMTLHPALEQFIMEAQVETTEGPVAVLEPGIYRNWIETVREDVAKVQEMGYSPIILTSEAARQLVKSTLVREAPGVVVLAVTEIAQGFVLGPLGEIVLEQQQKEAEK